jgi:hypothetical protein
MKKRVPPSYPVKVDYEGTIHQGIYTVSGGVIAVSYGVITNTTLTLGNPPQVLAQDLLLEIVKGGKWKP